jgi:membrane-associated phospholipid phosphatase
MRVFFLLEKFFNILFGKRYFLRTEDIDLLRAINPDGDEKTDGFFKAVSNMTALGTIAIGIPTVLYLWSLYKGDVYGQHVGLRIGFAFAVNLGITYLVKVLTHRTRPYIKYPDLNEKALENTPSFPSGHSSVAFQTATSLAIVFPCWQIAVPAYLWASTIVYSRLYLGVHYPSDVLGGILLGMSTAWLFS